MGRGFCRYFDSDQKRGERGRKKEPVSMVVTGSKRAKQRCFLFFRIHDLWTLGARHQWRKQPEDSGELEGAWKTRPWSCWERVRRRVGRGELQFSCFVVDQNYWGSLSKM